MCDTYTWRKAKPIHKRQHIISSEGVLHKDCDSWGSVKKIVSCREPQGACSQDELIGGEPPVVKYLLTLLNSIVGYSPDGEDVNEGQC
jgi:hypothetical protein